MSKGNWNKRNWKHGGTMSTEFKSWTSMKSRCLNKLHNSYARYGGRGITICERWIHSFENFLADMGKKPSLDYSLDRINNDGNYEPSNCRWATRNEQQNNTKKNIRLTHDGKTLTLHQWCDLLGFRYRSIKSRLHKGWPVDKALTVPLAKRKPYRLWVHKSSRESGVSKHANPALAIERV